MADFLRNWIVNITAIIIFIMFLDTIMPNNTMKRYINVIIGILIIIAVIKPILLMKDNADSFYGNILETANYFEKSGSAVNSEGISKYQKEKAILIFENNLKNEITRLVRNNTMSEYKEISVDLELERNIESKDLGNIKAISVALSNDKGKVIEVNRIKIGFDNDSEENINVINKDKAEYNLNDNKIKSEIKDVISKALGINSSIISVDIRQ